MPTASQHRGKADKNRRFLATIDPTADPEWAVTVAFYTAVHLVEQLRAAASDGHSVDHVDRLRYVQNELRPVGNAFRQLYDLSRLARYSATSEFFRQVTADDVAGNVIGGWLVAVELFVAERLAATDGASRSP